MKVFICALTMKAWLVVPSGLPEVVEYFTVEANDWQDEYNARWLAVEQVQQLVKTEEFLERCKKYMPDCTPKTFWDAFAIGDSVQVS